MWNSRKKDYKLRVFNWLVTVLLLTFLFAISSSSNDNYQFNVQKDADDYTDITNGTDPNYKSEDSYNAEGMAGLYNLMDSVLKSMISEGFDLNEVITVDNGISINSDKLIDVVKQCSGLMAVLVILLLLLVFMPLVGIFFCCCRCCCGNCGGKPNVSPLKPSATKKMVYGVILILLTTGLLFCVVCTFGTNEQLNDNVRGLPKNLKYGVNDLVLFFDNTVKEMDNLLTVNFGEFKDKFTYTMGDTQEDLKGSVSGLLNGSSLTYLTDFIDNFQDLEQSATHLNQQSEDLKELTATLSSDLKQLQENITKTCQDNSVITNICNELHIQDSFNLPITDDMFPNMTEQVSAFDTLSSQVKDFNDTIKTGMNTLNEVNNTIDTNFNDISVTTNTTLDEAGKTISDNLQTVKNTVGDMKKSIKAITDPLDDADVAIGNYFKYFWIVGVIISCVILMVLLCIVVGLIWGCCSPRPQQPSDQCCTKRGGGCFLICGTYTMFTLAVFMAVLALVMCILGVPVQRLVCDELEDPSNSKIFDLLDKTIDTSSIDLNFTLKSILNGCKNDKSLYNVFGLESQFNLTEITDKVNVNETIDSIDITGIFNSSFTIIDEDQLNNLANMGNYSIALNLSQIEETDSIIQNLSFKDARDNLEALKQQLPTDMAEEIEKHIVSLNDIEQNDLNPLKEEVNNFTATAKNFSQQTMMGCSDCTDFNDVILGIVESINNTQADMQTNGKDIIEEVTNTSLTNIKGLLNKYLNRVTDNVKDNIGKCGPINRVFNGITTSTCKKVFKPINGYWFGLFLALILFVPIIIFSVNLSILYQTTALSNYGNYNSNKKHKKSKRKHKARGYDSDAGQHYSSGQEYNGHQIVNMDRYADTSTRHRNHEGTTYF